VKKKTVKKKRRTPPQNWVKVLTVNKKYKSVLRNIGKKFYKLENADPKRVLQKIYSDILKTPAMAEMPGFRTAEHAVISVESKEGPMAIRVKGGMPWDWAVTTESDFVKLRRSPKRKILSDIYKKDIIEHKDYQHRDPTGFYTSPDAYEYYKIEKLMSKKCPESIIHHPIARIQFGKTKAIDKTKQGFFKGEKRNLEGIVELKKPVSYRLSNLNPTRGPRVDLGRVNKNIAKMLNSMIAESKGEKKKELVRYKRELVKELIPKNQKISQVIKEIKTGGFSSKVEIDTVNRMMGIIKMGIKKGLLKKSESLGRKLRFAISLDWRFQQVLEGGKGRKENIKNAKKALQVLKKFKEFFFERMNKNIDNIYEKTGYIWNPAFKPDLNVDMRGRFCDYDTYLKPKTKKEFEKEKKKINKILKRDFGEYKENIQETVREQNLMNLKWNDERGTI